MKSLQNFQNHSIIIFLDVIFVKMYALGINFSKPHDEKEFLPNDEVSDFSNKDWEELTHDTFNRIFKNSAIKRTRFEGLKRNIKAIS